MSVPTAGATHLVLVGATGMVGGYALRYVACPRNHFHYNSLTVPV
jgi:hypothetical protein